MRVLIVHALPVVRAGYAAVLSTRGFTVAGDAPDLEEGLRLLAEEDADVVILDGTLPRTTWRDACASIRRAAPGAGIILVVPLLDRRIAAEGHTVGVKGFLLETATPIVIRRAVRAVSAGGVFHPAPAGVPEPGTGQSGDRRPFGLTRQQVRVLELLARGLSNRAIAQELGISEHTVKSHMTQTMRKLHARDRVQAATIALREGLA